MTACRIGIIFNGATGELAYQGDRDRHRVDVPALTS